MIVVRVCGHCGRSIESSRPEARYCSDRCRAAAWKEQRGYGARRSGLQLSYPRAVRSVHHRLVVAGIDEVDAREIAEEALKDALPERQRQRLEARNAA